jgi:hypothetical protein
MSALPILLEPGRILLYRRQRLLVIDAGPSTATALISAQTIGQATALSFARAPVLSFAGTQAQTTGQAIAQTTGQAIAQTTGQAIAQTTGQAIAPVLGLYQRRYHLFLTPLGWAIDFRQEQLVVISLDWLPREMVGTILKFLPLHERITLQRLSSTMQRISLMDPEVKHLTYLPPENGFHQALARGDWQEIMLWHTRFPNLVPTEAEVQTPVGLSFQAFVMQENMAKSGRSYHGWRDLLRSAHRYGTLEFTRYLLRTHVYFFPDFQDSISVIFLVDGLAPVEVILDYVECKRPQHLPWLISSLANEAATFNEGSVIDWLAEKYGQRYYFRRVVHEAVASAAKALHWRLAQHLLDTYGSSGFYLDSVLYAMEGDPVGDLLNAVDRLVRYDSLGVIHVLTMYLTRATDRDQPVLDRLFSYLPNVPIPHFALAHWRTELVQRGQTGLVHWLDSKAWW